MCSGKYENIQIIPEKQIAEHSVQFIEENWNENDRKT